MTGGVTEGLRGPLSYAVGVRQIRKAGDLYHIHMSNQNQTYLVDPWGKLWPGG